MLSEPQFKGTTRYAKMPKEVGATRIHVISDKMEKEQFIKHRLGFMGSLLHRESIVIFLSHSIS